ncbi:MAG: hypothetical protein QW655_00270 [Nitrososphaerota archaeon]|nr:hypothetical protein [Candidatus Geocrenenecus dongiae]
MSLQKNVLALIILVTFAWLSFMAITYALSFTLFQAIENIDIDAFLGTLRVVIGVTVFVVWVYGLYLLTKIWLYKILLKTP